MSNPAFELHEIFDTWKRKNSGGKSMESVRGVTDHDGIKLIRRAFSLVSALGIEVAKLEEAGLDGTRHRETIDFCTRAVLGVPGAWQSRPTNSHQFPDDKMARLHGLGDLIASQPSKVARDLSAVPELLEEIECALDDSPELPYMLVQHIRRLISDIRTALSRVEDYGHAPVAEDLFALAVATKAAEAASPPGAKENWANFWNRFWGRAGEISAGAAFAGAGIMMALPAAP